MLGVRDLEAGVTAAKELGSRVSAIELDLEKPETIARAAGELGALDVVVNNAAVALNGFDGEVARRTIGINYFGTALVGDSLASLIRRPGAMVVVSSGMGELSILSPALQREFMDPQLDRARLDELMNRFVNAVAEKKQAQEGWPSNCYSVSKCGVNALVRLWAKQYSGIAVNAVCPGWVRTRMGGRSADRSVEEGADSIAWAAQFSGEPSGNWYRDRAEVEW